jgi:hypothetical protein
MFIDMARIAHPRRFIAIASTLVALGVVIPSAALAQSTTMYPSGDSLSLSSIPITIPFGAFFRGTTAYSGSPTCTFNGGAFTVPATGNKTGPVSVNFSTRPTLTGCTEIENLNKKTKVPVEITTGGTWTLSAQYGTAGVVVTVPGLTISVEGSPAWETRPEYGAVSLAGAWDNGFSAPVNVASAVDYGGPLKLYLSGGGEKNVKEFAFGLNLFSLTDTTHPASLPVLGP